MRNPETELVNLAQLQNSGTRTVEVTVNGVTIRVTEKLTDDGTLSKELGRAMQLGRDRMRAAERVLSLAEDAPEKAEADAELLRLNKLASNLDDQWTFDDRRIVVRRISDRFTDWNVEGLSLDFDSLYDAPLSNEFYESLYNAVRAKPIVGKPNAKR